MYNASIDNGERSLAFKTARAANDHLVKMALRELGQCKYDEDRADWHEFANEIEAKSGEFKLVDPDGYQYSVVSP